jgi:hypothetical protein
LIPPLGFACKLPIYISAGTRAPSFDVVIPQCYHADSRGITPDSDVIPQSESTTDDPSLRRVTGRWIDGELPAQRTKTEGAGLRLKAAMASAKLDATQVNLNHFERRHTRCAFLVMHNARPLVRGCRVAGSRK